MFKKEYAKNKQSLDVMAKKLYKNQYLADVLNRIFIEKEGARKGDQSVRSAVRSVSGPERDRRDSSEHHGGSRDSQEQVREHHEQVYCLHDACL